MVMYGPPGGGTPALLSAIRSVAEPVAALGHTRPPSELLEIVDIVGLGDVVCESCHRRPARYLQNFPLSSAPFLLCSGCLL